jgi:hypothetical protein
MAAFLDATFVDTMFYKGTDILGWSSDNALRSYREAVWNEWQPCCNQQKQKTGNFEKTTLSRATVDGTVGPTGLSSFPSQIGP